MIFLVAIFVCSTTFTATYKWVVDEELNDTQQPPAAGIKPTTLKPPAAFDGSETARTIEEQQKFLDTGNEKRQQQLKTQQRAAKEKTRQEKNDKKAKPRSKSFTDRPRLLLAQANGSTIKSTKEQPQQGA